MRCSSAPSVEQHHSGYAALRRHVDPWEIGHRRLDRYPAVGPALSLISGQFWKQARGVASQSDLVTAAQGDWLIAIRQEPCGIVPHVLPTGARAAKCQCALPA